MGFQITTLMENTAPKDCLAVEHGLSLLIEGEGVRFLYDTGASPSFLQNAKALRVDLSGLDGLILSHGHYDHTGGVTALLADGRPPKALYLGKDFFDERYARKKDGLLDISALVKEDTVMNCGVPCHVVEETPVQLAKGLWLVSGFSSDEPLERPAPHMLRRLGGALETDLFEDEVAVVVDTPNELALISGCSHVGILSMCRRTEKLFGRPVTAFLGGTHLMEADDARVADTCRLLRERGMCRLGACHCNGERAGAYFLEHFPGFFKNQVGSKVVFD